MFCYLCLVLRKKTIRHFMQINVVKYQLTRLAATRMHEIKLTTHENTYVINSY